MRRCSESWMSVAVVTVTFAAVLGPMLLVTAHHQSTVSERITSLPSQPMAASFGQFGGYVTVDEKEGRALFYYFVEAESQAASKPLVLWLNGGILRTQFFFSLKHMHSFAWQNFFIFKLTTPREGFKHFDLKYMSRG